MRNVLNCLAKGERVLSLFEQPMSRSLIFFQTLMLQAVYVHNDEGVMYNQGYAVAVSCAQLACRYTAVYITVECFTSDHPMMMIQIGVFTPVSLVDHSLSQRATVKEMLDSRYI